MIQLRIRRPGFDSK